MEELKRSLAKLAVGFDKFNERLDNFNERLDKFNVRLDKFDERLDKFDSRLNKLEETTFHLVNHTESTWAMINGIAIKADENFNKIDHRLGKIESRLNVLTNETTSNFSNVGHQLESIKDELTKIGVATRYEEEYQNLKVVKPE